MVYSWDWERLWLMVIDEGWWKSNQKLLKQEVARLLKNEDG